MNKKILIISGNLLKHQFFSLKILEKFQNASLILENYPSKVSQNYTKDNSKIIKEHFQKVKKYEEVFFKSYISKNLKVLKKRTLLKIKKGDINKKKYLNKIKKINPDLIILNATSILSKDYIYHFKNKIINFHAGYMPFYRGSGCNVWAFYFKELKYVGVTIHFVDTKVDHGNIIFRGKPNFSLNDNTHSIGCKNTIIGSKLAIKAINKVLKNPKFKGTKFKSNKIRFCKKKDFNSKVVIKIDKLIKKGLIKDFLK